MIRKLARWAGVLAIGVGVTAFGAENPDALFDDDFKIPFWYENVTVSGGFGYKDNVVLSSKHPQGSAFWSASGDVLLYRLPTRGWQFSAFGSFAQVGYLNAATGVSDEQVALAALQLSKDFGGGWKSGLGANYSYNHQVLDVTATQTNQFMIGEVLGHNFTGRWFVRKDIQRYWVEAEVSASRQLFQKPLDNIWQFGPRLTLGHSYARGSDVSLSYSWFYAAFDTRETVDASGFTVPHTSLYFEPQSIEVNWHHVWDEQKHWHTITKAGVELNEDNGSGYFDYWQFRVAEQIKYAAKTWEVSAQVRYCYYNYSVQTVSATDAALRHKTGITAGLRADKNFGKHWKVYVSYAYDQSLSNVDVDNYQANTTSAGLEWHF